jgi:hypothetical protein
LNAVVVGNDRWVANQSLVRSTSTSSGGNHVSISYFTAHIVLSDALLYLYR